MMSGWRLLGGGLGVGQVLGGCWEGVVLAVAGVGRMFGGWVMSGYILKFDVLDVIANAMKGLTLNPIP